ncbi:MAG: DUF4340 domain-containing protein [Phycisphaerales bacterium]|nr:DUF4340 domain-containing protein [Phycisphaerales bacterium]MCB9862450.1 DUF4340 domain-containing protein [Phycisphaerales bacterium]
MNSKTTLILVLALLLAVAGLWWLRPGPTNSSDADETGSKKLLGLDPDNITAFEIKSGNETACSFVKDQSDWRMTSPISGLAQTRTVADDVRLLAELDYDKAYSAKDDPPGDELTSLSKPRRIVKLTDKDGKAHVLRIGNQQALSSRTYVAKEGDDKIYLVDADLNKTLKRKLEDYRGKRVTEVNSADVVRVQVTGDNSFTAVKRPTGWAIDEPEKARADLTALNKIINGIAGLTVTKFIDDTPDSLRIYGLEPPRVTVALTTEKKPPAADESTGVESQTTTVAFGSVIDDNVFARLVHEGDTTVFQVKKSVLDNVAPELTAVRDKRIVELLPTRAQSISITTQSGESMSMTRDGVKWLIAPPTAEATSKTAEPIAVNDLLNTLRDLKAVGFEDGARTEFGLDDPRVKLRIDVQGRTEPIELAIGALTPSQTGAYVKNVTEDFIAVVPADDARKLVVEPVAFRSRDILSFKSDRVTHISLRRLSETIELAKSDADWKMTAPIDADANGAVVTGLLNELASLKGRAVVAKASRRAEFGLMQPQYTLTLTVTPPIPTTMPVAEDIETPTPRTIVLFASRHAGSRYAMVEGGEFIYEAEEKLVADLDQEFLDTHVLSFNPADVAAITFSSNEGAFRFTRNDDQWSLDGEATFSVDKSKLESALTSLGTLNALRYAAYENADTQALGLNSPQTRIRVEMKDGTPHELIVSGIGPNAADRYAQLAAHADRAFVIEGTLVTKFDKRVADFKK